MKTISIRELHRATGHWVRRAAQGEVEVTDRGTVVARLSPAPRKREQPYWANPQFTPKYLAIRDRLKGGTNATVIISEDRDHPTL